MTTIAWDGVTLATDSQTCTSNGMLAMHRVSVKIHPIGGGWVAGCGNRMDVLALARWLDQGRPPTDKPTFVNSDTAVLFIDHKRKCWHLAGDLRDDNQPWPARVAIGSGGELAWGAMHHYADAIQAVRIACKFDIGSGLPIQWVNTKTGDKGQCK